MPKRRGYLEKVEPQAGDACRVLDFDGRSVYREAEALQGEVLSHTRPGLALVTFRGREAEIAIEPDWAGQWRAGQVEYREVSPEPRVMDSVVRTAHEEHGWAVEMVLLGLHQAAESIGAQTFDRHWLVCLRRGEMHYEYYQEYEIYTPYSAENRPGMLPLAEPPKPQLRIIEKRREVWAWHEDTARKRAWIRWEVGRCAWIQTGNPEALAILDRCRPR